MNHKVTVAFAWASYVFVAGLGTAFAEDPPAANVVDAITGGKLSLSLRPRLELVEQDGREVRAEALTLRTLVGWQTKPWHATSVTAQLINVARIGGQRYNDDPGRAANSRFPTVPDPDNTDLNQIFLDYAGVPETRIRLGKQSIKLDNVCFVGNAEFRQVMQVFNGVTVANGSIPRTELFFAHLVRIKNTAAQQRETRIDLIHADYKLSPSETLAAFAYFQDQPVTGSNTGFADNSNRVLGIRADGTHPFGDAFKLLYTAEYAKQDDYAHGDERIDARYGHIGIGTAWPSWYVRLDRELRGSNNGNYGFQTPLGTNHLFQGWADQFTTIPKEGLRDTFISVGGKLGKAQLNAEFHRFKSDFSSIDFGEELDFSVSYAQTKQLSGKVEYADYRATDSLSGKRDLTKLWFTLLYAF